MTDHPSSLKIKKLNRIWLRRILSLILFGVLVYFFYPLIEEFGDAVALFRQAEWIWLVVAILVQVISYGFLTWLNDLSLRPFRGKIKFFDLAAVLTSMAFIQIAVPSAGASGVAMRVRLLGKFGYEPEDSLFSLMVETLLEAVALVTVASMGILYLLRRGDLSTFDVSLLVLGAVVGVGLMLYGWKFLRDRDKSYRLLNRLARLWNRIAGRIYAIRLENFRERLDIFQQNLVRFNAVLVMKLFLAAYAKVLLDVITMGACFYMFGYDILAGRLFTGYGLILTMSGMAALPGGLGMADAYVPVVFSWLAVPGSVALVAGLTYRLIAFWLVRFVGFFTWQYMEGKPKLP